MSNPNTHIAGGVLLLEGPFFPNGAPVADQPLPNVQTPPPEQPEEYKELGVAFCDRRSYWVPGSRVPLEIPDGVTTSHIDPDRPSAEERELADLYRPCWEEPVIPTAIGSNAISGVGVSAEATH